MVLICWDDAAIWVVAFVVCHDVDIVRDSRLIVPCSIRIAKIIGISDLLSRSRQRAYEGVMLYTGRPEWAKWRSGVAPAAGRGMFSFSRDTVG